MKRVELLNRAASKLVVRRGLLLATSVITATASSLVVFQAAASAFSGTGSGTSSDPYKITTCDQLEEIENDLSASYYLANSIDCTNTAMDPLGDSTTAFTGTFDGKGYAIENATLGSSGVDDGGIFGVASNATITDVRLKNITVRGNNNVGALVGLTSYTTISYIAASTVSVTANGDNVGGLVGQLGGSSIQNSFVEFGYVRANGTKTAGLVGYAVGPTTVSDSYVQSEIYAANIVGGVIGQLGVGPAYAQDLYADATFDSAGSDVVGNIAMGGNLSSSFMADSSYLGTSSVAPLDSWDFTNTWYVRPGNYPGLRPKELPQRLCNQPTSTNTSFTVSCTSDPLLQGDPHWELKYGYDDTSDRTALTTQAGQSFSVTVSNLLPGTTYDLQFRYVDATGTSPWGKVVVLTTGSSDVDGDGISNEVEALGPNGGDANNDGTPDYQQANVTTLPNQVSGGYTTLVTACTDNYNVQLGGESAQQADSAYDYPAGLLGFVVRGCTPGATTPVAIYYSNVSTSASYLARKWQHGAYAPLTGATFSTVSVGGQQLLKLSYNLTDGGLLDSDGIADGNIVDPVGLAVATTTTSPATLTPTGLNITASAAFAGAIVLLAATTRLLPLRKRA